MKNNLKDNIIKIIKAQLMLYAFVLFMGIIGVCVMLMNDIEDMIRVLCIGFIIIMTPFEISLIRHYLAQLRKLRRCSAHTQGTVVSVDESIRSADLHIEEDPDISDREYRTLIEYTVDGIRYTTHKTHAFLVRKGRHEKIHYNPSDLQDCHVSWKLRFFVVVTFIPILLILAFLFLLLFYVVL